MYASKKDTLPKEFVKYYNEGRINIYLLGYCEYINPVTGNKFIYEYIDRISNKPAFTVVVLKNTIKEIK